MPGYQASITARIQEPVLGLAVSLPALFAKSDASIAYPLGRNKGSMIIAAGQFQLLQYKGIKNWVVSRNLVKETVI